MDNLFIKLKIFVKKIYKKIKDLLCKIFYPYYFLQKKELEELKDNPNELVRLEKKKQLDKKMDGKSITYIVESDLVGVVLEKIKKPIDAKKIKEMCQTKVSDIGMYYHDKKRHQVIVPFDKDSAFRYQYRSDSKRKTLKPLLYPLSNKAFDRTHVIPIGYHGSENDNRLVVGWDAEQNRVDMSEFEKEVSEINKNKKIVWFTDIIRGDESNNYTNTWTTTIYDKKGKELLKKTFEYKCPFRWE